MCSWLVQSFKSDMHHYCLHWEIKMPKSLNLHYLRSQNVSFKPSLSFSQSCLTPPPGVALVPLMPETICSSCNTWTNDFILLYIYPLILVINFLQDHFYTPASHFAPISLYSNYRTPPQVNNQSCCLLTEDQTDVLILEIKVVRW